MAGTPSLDEQILKAAKALPSVSPRSPFYRRVRKRELLEYIAKYADKKKEDPSINVKMLKGLFSLKWGISMKTINDYLMELEAIGAVIHIRKEEGKDVVVIGKIGKELLT